jgi:hypothetical protein
VAVRAGATAGQRHRGFHPFASRSEQEWILRVQSAQPDLFGLPDVRYWATTFSPLWQPSDAYLALGAMSALSTRRIPEIRFSINPHADPAAIEIVARHVRGVPVLADLDDRADRRPR